MAYWAAGVAVALLLLVLGLAGTARAAVFTGNATLDTQAEVNAFGANGYTGVTGNLVIGPSVEIIDLTPLSTITTVGVALVVYSNAELDNLDGLSNITSVGGSLYAVENPDLGYRVYFQPVTQVRGFCGLYPLLNGGGLTGAYLVAFNAASPTQAEILFWGPCAPVDSTPPVVTITSPADGASFVQGSVVLADYECTDEDGGSGLATCDGVGGVADGAAIDTATAGPKTFTVTGTDSAGNVIAVTHDYTVLTPAEAIDQLAEDVAVLVAAGKLNAGQGDALTQKLANAKSKLDQGNTIAATNQLNAFINQVNGLINGGPALAEPSLFAANHTLPLLARVRDLSRSRDL
jgi:hypothetical protein